MNTYQTAYQDALLTVDQLEKLVYAAAALDDSESHTEAVIACLEIHYDLPAARRSLRQAETALINWGRTFVDSHGRNTHDMDTMFRTKSVHYRTQLAQILLKVQQ